MNPLWPTIASSLVFGTLVAAGITYQQFAHSRLLRTATRGESGVGLGIDVDTEEASGGTKTLLRWLKLIDLNELDGRLIRTGFVSTSRRVRWHLGRLIVSVAAPIITWFGVMAGPGGPALAAPAAFVALWFFYTVPSLMLLSQRRRWLRAVSSGVPTMLDMLVTAVEAGLGVDAALHHVGQEIRVMSPALAGELSLLNAEVAAGVPRRQALERFAARTQLPSLESLASTLIQVESQGAGIARALRAHAHLERRRRMLDAERRAAQASPRMTVVMVLFLIPALLGVLMGPAALNIMDHFIFQPGGA